MKTPKNLLTQSGAVALGVVVTTLIGCGRPAPEGPASPVVADTHDHPSEGPHGGVLIELGADEYHAEMVHDDAAGSVTIYLLDSGAKEATPIEAAELLINLSHDGQAEQFTLAASPMADDPAGKSSRFVSTDAELAEDLDSEHAEAQLVVTISGKQFRGEVRHDHEESHDDHTGHDEDEAHGADHDGDTH